MERKLPSPMAAPSAKRLASPKIITDNRDRVAVFPELAPVNPATTANVVTIPSFPP